MPRGNGTGPKGRGQGGGGQGSGRGGRQGKGRGRGRMGGPFAAGPGGGCICPSCGYAEPHVVGQPCSRKACPECGTKLVRQ